MAKNLRIISINFPFKNPSVQWAKDFAIKEALFDFDVVVMWPYLLAGSPVGRFSVNWREFQSAKHEVTGKKEHDEEFDHFDRLERPKVHFGVTARWTRTKHD